MPMNAFFFYTAFPSIAHCSSLAMPTTKPDPERLAILKAHSTFGTCVCVCIARPCACVCVCMCPCLVACTYNAYARSSTRRDCKMTTGTKGLWNLGSRKVMRLGSWRRCWKMERHLNGLLHFCSHIPPMITGLPGIYLLEVPPVKFTFLDIKKGGLNEDMDILACLLDSFDREETS